MLTPWRSSSTSVHRPKEVTVPGTAIVTATSEKTLRRARRQPAMQADTKVRPEIEAFFARVMRPPLQ
jgi:hypothetical protein